MTDKKNLAFGITLAILFIIWVPLVSCGVQYVANIGNGAWMAAAAHISNNTLSAWEATWSRCLQTSWAFLGFMLLTIMIWFFMAKGGNVNAKINNYNFKAQEEKVA